jgi:NAD(P)-dependent dehydrogenase (short-subunit alcohol dehydrogenase family)
LQFASEGALLYISDINEPAAHKAAEYITKQYPTSECQSVKCDVSSEEDIKVLVENAVAKWGRLDVMVSLVSLFEWGLCLWVVQQRWYHAWKVSLSFAKMRGILADE